jgi:putative ABC transport system permease protein
MGLVGLALAVVGIYGVVSQSARQPTREIGIRMAVGAEARDVFRLVLGRGVVLVATSGLIAAVAVWACYVPARRVTRPDPMQALRHK